MGLQTNTVFSFIAIPSSECIQGNHIFDSWCHWCALSHFFFVKCCHSKWKCGYFRFEHAESGENLGQQLTKVKETANNSLVQVYLLHKQYIIGNTMHEWIPTFVIQNLMSRFETKCLLCILDWNLCNSWFCFQAAAVWTLKWPLVCVCACVCSCSDWMIVWCERVCLCVSRWSVCHTHAVIHYQLSLINYSHCETETTEGKNTVKASGKPFSTRLWWRYSYPKFTFFFRFLFRLLNQSKVGNKDL